MFGAEWWSGFTCGALSMLGVEAAIGIILVIGYAFGKHPGPEER